MNQTNPQFRVGGFFHFLGLGLSWGSQRQLQCWWHRMPRRKHPVWNDVRIGAKVATTGVRIGAKVATTGVRIGAEAPRRPTAQRRPTTQKQRSSFTFTRPRTAPEIGHSVLL